MPSPICERAITDALGNGRALLKFISANDAGLTGGHQCGFYLPVSVWRMFTPQAPENGVNHKHVVEVLWQDGLTTESAVTWYGRKTRHEYRMTRFGRDFPFLNADAVGNLLVLIPITTDRFLAYVLDTEDDIGEVQAALGVEVIDRWGVYEAGAVEPETEDDCIDRHFREFAGEVEEFPTGESFSIATRHALVDCVAEYMTLSADDRLVTAIDAEYRLFRLVERRLCYPDICRLFESVDDFLKTAATIMNRRKSRAGRSFENHVEYILNDAEIPHEIRPPNVDGAPDVVIPSARAYEDPHYPTEKLFIVGLKTTCKDRWRQVTREGRRVPRKHLLTLQRGISANQLEEMRDARVSLVVPQGLHKAYPPDAPLGLVDVEEFIADVRRALA